MSNGDGGISADQAERLIERLGEVVARLDSFILEVKVTYVRADVHDRDLARLADKVAENKEDITSIRANLAKLAWLVGGGVVSVVAGIITVILVAGVQP